MWDKLFDTADTIAFPLLTLLLINVSSSNEYYAEQKKVATLKMPSIVLSAHV